MPTNKEQIISVALIIIKSNPDGVRYSELCRNIEENLPNIAPSYISSIIVKLDKLVPNSVCKIGRGLFGHIKGSERPDKNKEVLKESHRSRQVYNTNANLIPIQYHKK